MSICLGLILLPALAAGPVRAEDIVPAGDVVESDQYDMYYDAMLRSIELDKNRWKTFSRSVVSGPWFYDTQSLKRNGSKVTVQVTVFPHPNKTELYRSVYPEHSQIRKIVFVTEINCSAYTYRQPLISVYGYYKDLLAEHSTAGVFAPIKPGTTTDTLKTLVCSSSNKRKKH